jgi:hypothetical protein
MFTSFFYYFSISKYLPDNLPATASKRTVTIYIESPPPMAEAVDHFAVAATKIQ